MRDSRRHLSGATSNRSETSLLTGRCSAMRVQGSRPCPQSAASVSPRSIPETPQPVWPRWESLGPFWARAPGPVDAADGCQQVFAGDRDDHNLNCLIPINQHRLFQRRLPLNQKSPAIQPARECVANRGWGNCRQQEIIAFSAKIRSETPPSSRTLDVLSGRQSANWARFSLHDGSFWPVDNLRL